MDNENEVVKAYFGYNATAVSKGRTTDSGLTPTEDTSRLKDREVNLVLSRDDDGCKDAYENCADVFNNVERKVSLLNSGIIVKTTDKEKYKEQVKLLERKRTELNLETFLDFSLTNRELYSLGAIALKKQNKKLLYLVGISTKNSARTSYQFIPILNSVTGKLGVRKLDPKNKRKVVTAIQKAVPIIYNNKGDTSNGTEKITYYDEGTLMLIGLNTTEMYGKSMSPVRRSLRYSEGLMRLENTTLLLSRRPTQLIFTAGNKDHNLMNAQIPLKYLDSAESNELAARQAFKTARLNALATEAKKLTAGSVLAQVLEYGTEISAIEVPEGLPYVDYMKYFSEKIKMSILAVDVPTQRIVRSSAQETNTIAELIEKAESEQKKLKTSINNNITSILLEEDGGRATIDDVYYDFAPIQRESATSKASFWVDIAKAMETFMSIGLEVPEDLRELVENSKANID